MSKKNLVGSAAALALTAALGAPAFADETPDAPARVDLRSASIDGHYGSLDAFWGSLDAFWGSLDAFWGSMDAFGGEVGPQYGSLDAFWGSLDAFGGKVGPQYGSLDAFWGSLDAFDGDIQQQWGSLDAFYGSLDALYGSLDAFWGSLDAFWGSLDAFNGDPSHLQGALGTLFGTAEQSFGAVFDADGFDVSIRTPLMEKYGLGSNFEGAENLTRGQYAALMLDLHDQMMQHTGVDQVDHWMGKVRWSPSVSEHAGNGSGVRVGILDTRVSFESTFDTDIRSKGYRVAHQTHGAAVASIIAAAHDRSGVMGIAPEAALAFHNPFDETMTASWPDVEKGLRKLMKKGQVDVINMSLGVSGHVLHQDWREVFAKVEATRNSAGVVFIKAAGNDGVQQKWDIDWGTNTIHDQLLIVGSVNPYGNISAFSNTPGEACLIVSGACTEQNKLKYRFLVAPGELVLVADDKGGVTRASGTSFAAPMVTGAVSLLQSRWGWLKQNPEETADIILQSATDLGAPGVDAVYGWGLLNIDASQAPLDPNALVIETVDGPVPLLTAGGFTASALNLLGDGVSVTAFENIGDTYRDFEVPVSAMSAPLTDATQSVEDMTEDYLAQQLAPPVEASTTTSKKKQKKKKVSAFTDVPVLARTVYGSWQAPWSARFDATPRDRDDLYRVGQLPFAVSATAQHNASGMTLRIGEGHGGIAFSGGNGFGRVGDHDIRTGGANPVLGLASGGVFAGIDLPVTPGMTFSFGYSADEDRHQYADRYSGEAFDTVAGLAAYRASAFDMGLGYAVNDSTSLKLSYTRLDEATGLLGGQGVGAFSLEGGSSTDAATIAVHSTFRRGLMVSASATAALTQTDHLDSALSVSDGGLRSTALQVTTGKAGIFGDHDRLRLSIAQPLHVDDGGLTVTTLQVVDRVSGERGLVTSSLAPGDTDRRIVSEILYDTPVGKDGANLGLFGQIDLNNRETGLEKDVLTGGLRFDIAF